MSRDINKVMVSGRLGRDPELRITPGGESVATFSVASGRSSKLPDGSYKNDTEWFRIVAWQKLAETVSTYLHKGSHVFVEGRLQTREWQDTTGQKRYSTEIIASDMVMLDNKPQGDNQNQNQGSSFDDSDELDPAPVNTPPPRQNGYNANQQRPQGNQAPRGNYPPQNGSNARQQSNVQQDQDDVFGSVPAVPQRNQTQPQRGQTAIAPRPPQRQQAPIQSQNEVELEDVPF